MNYQRILRFKSTLTLLAFIILLTGLAFGQGKGKGNGGGNGRGGGHHQADNANRGGGKKTERAFPQTQDQPYFRGRGNGDGRENSPVFKQQERSSRVEYLGPPIAQPPRGNGGDNRGRGPEKKQRREFERQERQIRIVEPSWNDDRRSRNGHRRDEDQNYDRSRRFPQYFPPRAWPNNYGAYRSAEVHERNERRKAEKNALKAWDKSYDRDERYYRSEPSYDDRNYEDRKYLRYNDGSRDRLLRTVIGNVFNSSDPYYRYQSYTPRTVYRQVYQPAYYEPNYYPYPADYYQYSPVYVDDPYRGDDIVSRLGFGDSNFGGIVSRIFSELLAVGYNDGYQAGQYARSSGYRDGRAYNDPYDPYVYEEASFNNIDYNPYSCLAENRRYLSEGYELGYQDGLRDAGGQGDLGNGSLDLVSVLLGNIL